MLAHRDHASQPRARGCASDGVFLCPSCVSACGQLAGGNRRGAGSVWSPTDSGRGPMTDTDIARLQRLARRRRRAFLGELGRRQQPHGCWTENARPLPAAALREPTRALAAALTAEFGPPEFGPPRVFRPLRGPAVPGRARTRTARTPACDGGRARAGTAGTPCAVLSAQGLAVRVGHQALRRRAASPLPGGRRPAPPGEALGRGAGGGAARRRPGAGRRAGAGADGRGVARRDHPRLRLLRLAGAARRPRRGRRGTWLGAGGGGGAGRGRRGGRPGRWPTGSTPTSGRANRCSPRVGLPTSPDDDQEE